MSIKTFTSGSILVLISLLSFGATASPDYSTEEFSFISSGASLNGIISRPENNDATSIVVMVHGYGPTNVVKGDWYRQIRSEFTSKGISVLTWDKPGCGKSEGEFDINQPIESSADEVVSAIAALKKSGEPGSDRIGLMGFSRAGWIAPVAISREPNVSFWISVSGTDAYENWGYLLRSNLELEGYSSSEIDTVYKEWIDGNLLFNSGGPYEQYLSATRAFRKNEMVQKLSGQQFEDHKPGTDAYEAAHKMYLKNQKKYMSEGHLFDDENGLPIVVSDFDQVLKSVSGPVLAIFGDNDRNVDWRKTKELYESTIGVTEPSKLSVKVFKGADHNLRMSKTGGYLEPRSKDYWSIPYAEGYYEVMVEWLCSNGFCSNTR